MTQEHILPHGSCERHPYTVHIAKALDATLTELGIKAAWLAKVVGISEALLSDYRTGNRPIPPFRMALIDQALDGRFLLRAFAEIYGCLVLGECPSETKVEKIESLQESIQRAHGEADAVLTKALRDHVLTDCEKRGIHPLAAKMRKAWQEVEDRTLVPQ